MTIEDRVHDLRRDFDASFSRAVVGRGAEAAQLLLVRAGSSGLALRLDELSLLERAGTIVPVPGSSPELVGLAAVRGRLVAVFDVARVLGAAAAEATGFIAVTRADPTIGLLLSSIEGQTEIARELAREDAELLTLLPLDGGTRRRVSVAALIRHVGRVKDEVRT